MPAAGPTRAADRQQPRLFVPQWPCGPQRISLAIGQIGQMTHSGAVVSSRDRGDRLGAEDAVWTHVPRASGGHVEPARPSSDAERWRLAWRLECGRCARRGAARGILQHTFRGCSYGVAIPKLEPPEGVEPPAACEVQVCNEQYCTGAGPTSRARMGTAPARDGGSEALPLRHCAVHDTPLAHRSRRASRTGTGAAATSAVSATTRYT